MTKIVKDCYWRNKPNKQDGSNSFSILTYDKKLRDYQGRTYCKECAKILNRVILANLDDQLYSIENEIETKRKRIILYKRNVRKYFK